MIDVADANKSYYYHFDGLGSVIALSDVNSQIVENYSYDVFGEPNRVSDVNNPYMFTARRFDPNTGLYYYRARYYKPEIGRFLQPDPIGYLAGLNLYTYCGNNPVNWIDPWGLWSWGWLWPPHPIIVDSLTGVAVALASPTGVGGAVGVGAGIAACGMYHDWYDDYMGQTPPPPPPPPPPPVDPPPTDPNEPEIKKSEQT